MQRVPVVRNFNYSDLLGHIELSDEYVDALVGQIVDNVEFRVCAHIKVKGNEKELMAISFLPIPSSISDSTQSSACSKKVNHEPHF